MGNCHGEDFIGAGGGAFFGDQSPRGPLSSREFHGGQLSGG